jgi:PST family polysaccharide transporter
MSANNMDIPFRRISANAIWLVADKFSRIAIGFVLFALIARHLGPEKFGTLNLAIAVVALLSPIATLSMDRITIKDFVDAPENSSAILVNTFFLRIIGGFSTWILACLFAWYYYGYETFLITAILGLVPVLQAIDVVDNYFQSRLEVSRVVIARLLSLGFSSLFRVYLLMITDSVFWFAVAALLEAVFMYSVMIIQFFCWKKFILVLTVSKKFIVSRFIQSWPLIVSGFAYITYMRIPYIFIGSNCGLDEVSYYSVSLKCIEGLLPVVHIVANSMYPVFVKMILDNRSEFYSLYLKYLKYIVAVAYILLLLTVLFSNFIIVSIFGSQYVDAVPVFRILAISQFFMIVSVFRSSYLTIVGMQKHIMIASVLGCLLSLIGSYIFVRAGGAIAASWLFVVIQILVLFLYDSFSVETRHLFKIHLNGMTLGLFAKK